MAGGEATTRVGIVMAGGAGERFWPVSRTLRPKPLLRFGPSGRTLLEDTLDLLRPVVAPDRLLVVTGESLREPILRSVPALSPDHVLAEPCRRSTLGCIAFAAAWVLARCEPDPTAATLAVLPADSYVADCPAYASAVGTALAAAEHDDALVVMGVAPTRPETGYGYIEVAADAEPLPVPGAEQPVWPVASFREKPDAEAARAFVEAGRFYWNAGTFFWRISSFLGELGSAQPRCVDIIGEMTDALRADDGDALRRAFERLPNMPIDFALMEHARTVQMVRADFEWDDIGTWGALRRVGDPDADGNVTVGDPVLIGSRNCIVYNEPGAESIAVAVLGMEGIVVSVSEDAVLVVPEARAQDVREVVAELRNRGSKQV